MVLRIEDTDQKRTIPGAASYIVDSLDWLGIKIDEGYGTENQPHGSYVQSERVETGIYRNAAEALVASGHAYFAFDTPEELAAMGESYSWKTRGNMRNSLTMSSDEVARLMSEDVPYVIRAKAYEPNPNHHLTIVVDDMIRGLVKVETEHLDDKVLVKSDGMPTYHLAATVDDIEMQITHVIRGEDWLPSAPLHVLMYGWLGAECPKFAHLPLVLRPDGNGKLSKRDGDAGGFPVYPLQWTDPATGDVYRGYREDGYLPEAVYNMLSFIGWHPGNGDNRELLTPAETAEIFTLDRVSKNGAKFNPKKARWYNREYLNRDYNLAELTFICFPYVMAINGKRHRVDYNYIYKSLDLVRSRMELVSDIKTVFGYLFTKPTMLSHELLTPEAGHRLHDLAMWLESQRWEGGNPPSIELDKDEAHVVRAALTGSISGFPVTRVMSILGRNETVMRLMEASYRCVSGRFADTEGLFVSAPVGSR